MTTPTLVLLTIVTTLAAAWAARALWRYMRRVHEAVRHAERFEEWAKYREGEVRRLWDAQSATQRALDGLTRSKAQQDGPR